MSEAKITIIGFNKYMQTVNDDLFKYLNLPDGIDKQSVIDNIMMRGGEFEVVYSDPYFMQDSIKVWSYKWYRTFKKWIDALAVEYNPLDNYNRHEEWTDQHTGTGSINTKTELDNVVTDESGSTTEKKVSAFDSSSYEPKESEHIDFDNESTTSSEGKSDTTTADNKTIVHNSHIHGNIGVTTSQQMLQSELDIALFNLTEQISDIFLREYVIPIY